MKNTFRWARILVLVASVFLAGALFTPIWQIQLSAPQYPEGLTLEIYAKGLAGDVDVVNGLNHYIGMRTLHSEDFIEFTLLPYIIGSLALLGLVAVILNRKGFYYAYTALFMVVAVVSMIDFYRWEYNYGHNLDPHAPIQVPGMFYQPPLIGFKQLLNFGALSLPATGGWLFIGAGVALVVAWLLLLQPKWLAFRKKEVALALVVLLGVSSCSSGPGPIRYGTDICDFCKMTIMQKKFSSEWVTAKGKVFRFDDLHCMLGYVKKAGGDGTAYINDFAGKKEFVPANDLFFVKDAALKTPMGGNIAAFAYQADAAAFLKTGSGTAISWQQLEAETKK